MHTPLVWNLEYHLPPTACDNEEQVLPADPKADEELNKAACKEEWSSISRLIWHLLRGGLLVPLMK